MACDILCVGHASYDLSLCLPEFPLENSKTETDRLLEAGGGPAANAAYLLGLWGARAGFAGLIGDDYYGRRIVSELESVGVDISSTEIRPGHPTPLSFILVNQRNASRTIVNRKAPGAALRLDSDALRRHSARVLLFDGHEVEASLSAVKAFPGAITILDAGSYREGTALLAGAVTCLAASERFALQATGLANLAGESNRRACLKQLRQRYRNQVIITLGEQGLIADAGKGGFYLPAFPAPAMDTTAAGDTFHGALAYCLAQGMEWEKTLRFASMAASLSVRTAGGRGSIPALDQVNAALNSHGV